MQTEDGQIIYQCLNGDPAMFGVLVDKYRQGIYALIYSKIGNFHDAQDVTQEAFIKAFRKLRTLKHWETFAFWLSTIANNLCKDFIKARAKRPDRDFVEDQSPDLVDNTSIDSYHDDLVHRSLHEALNSLPEIYRQVIALHYLSGYKSMDIAKLLGVSLRTVTERLKIGRERLKEEMITMMSETFKEQRLSAGFTFRIVEIVKRIKIQPVSTMKGLPWGLSLATGIIIAVLSLNPYMPQLDQFGTISGALLLSESKVLKVGEIPVDVVKVSNVPILSSKVDKGKGGEPKQPDLQNSFFMAPQAKGGEWINKADMQDGRIDFATCAVDGKIYAIGGSTKDGLINLSTVEGYDPKTNKWAWVADMPSTRIDHSANAVDGKIYVIGGSVDSTWPHNMPVIEYDPAKDKWTIKSSLPNPMAVHCSAVVNGKIYVFGGLDAADNTVRSVFEYDPASDKWAQKTDMPTARCFASASMVNDKIYVIGGSNGALGVGGEHALATVEEYDPATDTWTAKADMLTVRGIHTSGVVNGRIYVIGGAEAPFKLTPEVYKYDPMKDRWESAANIPTPRIYLSASEVNGRLYAIGGQTMNQPVLTLVEEYTPEGWQTPVSPQNKLPRTWGNIKSK